MPIKTFTRQNACLLFLGIILCSFTNTTIAQTLPASADASRLDERFPNPIQYNESYITPPEQLDSSTSIPSAINGFTLKSITLQGMTVFSQNDFQELINEYTNREVDLNVLSHLTNRINKKYRDAGYFLSTAVIPQQEIKDGEVTIQIIEGYVQDVIVNDPLDLLRAGSQAITKQTINLIKGLRPLHGPSFERYMLLLNDGTGIKVTSTLIAPKTPMGPGAVNIILSTFQNDSSITAGYNNHGSRYIGQSQLDASYLKGNIFTPYDSLALQLATTLPADELIYGSVSYATLLNANGLKFSTSASYTNANPGLELESLEVESRSLSWQGGFSYPYIRSRRENLTFDTSLTIKNSSTEFLDQELIDDKIRFLTIGAHYNGKNNANSINSANISVSRGLNLLGATKTGSTNLSRAGGKSDFIKFMASVARMQNFPQTKINILGQVEGQYSPNPLLSAVKFGYGGSTLGRAYDPSEITGDSGISAGLEIRYNGLPPITDAIDLTPFAFYDIGKVWQQDNGTDPISGASAGFGAYYQINNNLNGALIAAYPLTKSVNTPVMGGDDGPRILFNLKTTF